MDDLSSTEIQNVVRQMKDRSFQFDPILKKTVVGHDGRSRTRGIPSGMDMVIQEAMRMILEPALESKMLDSSHGFRTGRNEHTALRAIRRNWSGITWLIQADMKGFFSNVDYGVLSSVLMKEVKDQQLVDLYWKLVKAGLVNRSPSNRILSNLLSNVYLHELDKRMDRISKMQSGSAARIRYVRHADEWVIGVQGNKTFALEIQDEVVSFLAEELKVELDEEKIRVIHLPTEKGKFLGTLLKVRSKEYTNYLLEQDIRVPSKQIVMEAPINELVKLLVRAGFAVNDRRPRGMTRWVFLRPEEILRRYNSAMRSIMTYYSFVDNKNMLQRVVWILRFSAVFTLCRKWNLSTRGVFRKLGSKTTILGAHKNVVAQLALPTSLAKTPRYFALIEGVSNT